MKKGEAVTKAEIISVLKKLRDEVEIRICTHEDTYRGGVIWEICSQCGDKWADDEGGRPENKLPSILDDADNLIKSLDSQKAIF